MEIIDRVTAKSKKLKHFFTNCACGYGHISPRFVSSGGCIECSKLRARERRKQISDYQKQYREQTKEKRLKYHQDYYQENKAMLKQKSSDYRNEHSEYYTEYSKQYYTENCENIKQYSRERYKNNSRRILDDKKEYYKENQPAFIARNAKRRAAKLQATPQWVELEEIRTIYEASARLTEKTGIQHNVDHIIPLQSPLVCGLHCLANLQVLTAVANGTKSNKMPKD